MKHIEKLNNSKRKDRKKDKEIIRDNQQKIQIFMTVVN